MPVFEVKGQEGPAREKTSLSPSSVEASELGENKERGRLCLGRNRGSAHVHGDDAEIEFHGLADQGEKCARRSGFRFP